MEGVWNSKCCFFTKAVKSRRGWESRQKNRLLQVGFSLETGFRDTRWQSREPLAQLSTAKCTPFTVLRWNPTLRSTLRIKFSKATLILWYNIPTCRYCYIFDLEQILERENTDWACHCRCCYHYYSTSWITSRLGFTWEEVGRDDQSGYNQQKKTGHPATDSGRQLPNNLTNNSCFKVRKQHLFSLPTKCTRITLCDWRRLQLPFSSGWKYPAQCNSKTGLASAVLFAYSCLA